MREKRSSVHLAASERRLCSQNAVISTATLHNIEKMCGYSRLALLHFPVAAKQGKALCGLVRRNAEGHLRSSHFKTQTLSGHRSQFTLGPNKAPSVSYTH
jgi:hypothetical protein